MPIQELKKTHGSNRLRLTTQVFLALAIAVFIVGFWAGEFVRRIETRNMIHEIEQRHINTTNLLSAISIDAVITEDGPLLETIASQAGMNISDIHALTIKNENLEILTKWVNPNHPLIDNISTFSSDITFEGEKFGQIEIDWNIQANKENVAEHVFLARMYSTIAIIAISSFMILLIYFLILRKSVV